MSDDLHDMTSKELISVVQDYQEMTSEIESVINSVRDKPDHLLQIRAIIMKYMDGPHEK